jgi:hypothetical protein
METAWAPIQTYLPRFIGILRRQERFNPNGTLISESMWGYPSLFYQPSPASYYTQWFHANTINGQQFPFLYDDGGGYSNDVGCSKPQTLVVAVGW